MKSSFAFRIFTSFSCLLLLAGCGYTQKNVLPQGIKTIHVETVQNKIPLDQVSVYEPGLEIKITDAVIRRFQRDGNLRVVDREHADAILEMDFKNFEQEGLRFNSLEQVEEFRMFITVDLRLKDPKTKELILEEPNFSGDAEYVVSDVRSTSRSEAAGRAADRLARNVVDRIVEEW